jgi:large subunit ribosomal protein L1
MDKASIVKALKQLREEAKERKFKQTFELIVNLKDLNLKNPDDQVEFFTSMPKPFKAMKICAIVGGELKAEADKVCDFVIEQSDLNKYKADKKAAKKLASEYDFFVAQANIMGPIAGAFGRVFGPRGKMPNPKAGCVVPPKASLQPLYDRLQSTIKISAKKFPVIQLAVGKEEMSDDEIAENVVYIYDQVEHHLPKERHNVRGALVKMTMGKPIKVQ